MTQSNLDLFAGYRLAPKSHLQVPGAGSTVNPGSEALSGFNGYYILDDEGAFFTIDTTITVTYDKDTETFTPTYAVETILCVDGENPISFDFSGSSLASFTETDGNYKLTYTTTTAPIVTVALTFTRAGVPAGSTAQLSGTVTPSVSNVSNINGYTYNNPILPSSYSGSYYDKDKSPEHVMTIGADFELLYSARGVTPPVAGLNPVSSYKYNMNMYYFEFTDSESNLASLIMGTSAAAGMVSNNITVVSGKSQPRTLTTIQAANQDVPDPLFVKLNENNAKALADLAGFYPLNSSGAFLSVEGIYASRYFPSLPNPKITTKYKVSVGLSFDGVNSKVYYYDTSCTFDAATNALTIPNVEYNGTSGSWMIVFAPGYQAGTGTYPQYGTLCGVTVTFLPSIEPIDEPPLQTWTGKSPLGPVPLSAFAGAKLTTKPPTQPNGETLQIVSDHSILYTPPAGSLDELFTDEQQSWLEFLYVPLMYIVAYQVRPDLYPIPDPALLSCMLSLGTNGPHGIASINTRYTHQANSITPAPLLPTSVVAIPNPPTT
mmetsp:Transcript_28583/g.53772  ORF Transcript_28583/g.53772 Transcript_28583/m.53772 type:complete len:546 (+) Transcript_28583:882-2519(+)